jgi:glycosyltransferase involved in cell wall biosynthesis
MRVLHVIPDLKPERGGPSRSTPEVCRALAESGTEVTLYSTHEPGEPLTIDPERVPYEVVLFDSKAGLTGAAWKLSRQIAADAARFDLVHIHSLWNVVATLSAAGSRRARLPYVVSPMGMLDHVCLSRRRTLKRLYAALFERRTIEGASLIHFLSDAEAESRRVEWFRFPKHFVAPNGVDLKQSDIERGSFRRRFPELKDRPLMLYLGRLHPIKGLDLQLQAVSALVKSNPRLLWVLIGPDDGEWQRLYGAIRRMGLEDNVRWLGPMMGPERLAALAEADVVVQTSFYECHSVAVSEAMAVGAPLVITDTVHRPEVQQVGAGYVVGRNADQLASAVEEIYRSPERAEAMRVAGRSFAARSMTWKSVALNLNAVYRELLGGAVVTDELCNPCNA